MKLTCLDPNHTHFILVDDGSKNEFGVEIKFRAKLENELNKHKSENSTHYGIPTILVVVGGGINTLKTIIESAENGIPIVILIVC